MAKSTGLTNILGDDFRIYIKNNSCDASRINVNNERHGIIIHNMVRSGLLDSNQHENKWCCASETSEEFHRCKLYSALENTSPNFA